MMSEFVARYELGRQWWQGWHKGNKGAPPNTNPLGVGAKLRAAGAVRAQSSFWRSMPQRQRPRTMAVPHLVLVRSWSAEAVVDMFIDGMRTDVAKSKARRVQTRNDAE